MRYSELIDEHYQLDEGLGDYIFKKIDDLLGAPKPHPNAAAIAVSKAPPALSDEDAQRLITLFLQKKENERLALMAAEAQKTTVEKIVPYLTYFVRQFVDRWRNIPSDGK